MTIIGNKSLFKQLNLSWGSWYLVLKMHLFTFMKKIIAFTIMILSFQANSVTNEQRYEGLSFAKTELSQGCYIDVYNQETDQVNRQQALVGLRLEYLVVNNTSVIDNIVCDIHDGKPKWERVGFDSRIKNGEFDPEYGDIEIELTRDEGVLLAQQILNSIKQLIQRETYYREGLKAFFEKKEATEIDYVKSEYAQGLIIGIVDQERSHLENFINLVKYFDISVNDLYPGHDSQIYKSSEEQLKKQVRETVSKKQAESKAQELLQSFRQMVANDSPELFFLYGWLEVVKAFDLNYLNFYSATDNDYRATFRGVQKF